jgi:ApbE superfamily uncharacterized protein (UPF0280 family)
MGMTNRSSMKVYKESHRFYRYQHRCKEGWVSFQARYRETDLWIRARCALEEEARQAVLNCRRQLEEYISRFPDFLQSLSPLPDDPFAPPLVRQMLHAAQKTGVGPMASVAGAIAQSVGLDLRHLTPSIIIENGGDCYLDLQEETSVGIFAGPDSPFTGKVALRFTADRFPLGICTSSGTVGHSLSFGKADAVTVVSLDAALADAAATALGNLVRKPQDIGKALELAPSIPHIEGTLIAIGDKIGIWGDLEIIPLQGEPSR